jgi:hypothetical protein
MTLFYRQPLTKLSSRAKRGFCILLFAGTPLLTFAQLTLPSGWRRPTSAEAAGQWRRKSPTRFLVVKADFDGNGHKDIAELLIEEKGKRCGLFVRLSGEHGEWQSLHQFQGLFDLGIGVVRPAKYETLCGSDPSGCDPETAKVLDLKPMPSNSFLTKKLAHISIGTEKRKSFAVLQ